MAYSAITFSPGEVSAYYAVRVPDVKQKCAAEWRGPCPVHSGTDDNFAVKSATGQAFCHSLCGQGWDIIALEMELSSNDFKAAKAEVFRIVGRVEPEDRRNSGNTNENSAGRWRELARYPYVDRDGNLLSESARFLKPDGAKTFVQERPSGVKAAGTTDPARTVATGGVVVGLGAGKYIIDTKVSRAKGKTTWIRAKDDKQDDYNGAEYCFRECPRVPYRLPSVLKSQAVILVEGEKDVHSLEDWGLTASCNPGGSGNSHLYTGWADYFRDRDIVIVPDNDAPGRKHAAAVAEALLGVAASIRILELPGLREKGDITDWRDAGGTLEQFQRLIEAAPPLDAATLAELRARWGQSHEQVHAEPVDDWPESTGTNWPEQLGREAYHGPAGELVHAIEPHSEADPAAILIQFLVVFGNLIGRAPYFLVEADRHFTNLYAVLVGQTAKGRKGTSFGQVNRIAEGTDGEWAKTRMMGGLASGEGLIWAVRDEIREQTAIKEKGRVTGYEEVITDPGVKDKRLLVVEPEFARVLQVTERDANTLSAVMRQGWDTGNLQILTKKQSARATNAHISTIGHITKNELKRLLTDTATANGFANRFLWPCVRRSKLLPEGGALQKVDFGPILRHVKTAADFARGVGQMQLDESARAIWWAVYQELSEGKPGMLGSVTSRAEAQTLRIACIYALLDCSAMVRADHLLAALEVWRYCEDSARFIFGDALGDATADEILRELRQHPEGVTRNDLREHFNRNKPSAEISRALGVLQEYGLARVERTRENDDQKRPTERWFALSGVRGLRG